MKKTPSPLRILWPGGGGVGGDVPTPGVPSAHPALEPAEPTELADQPEPERRGRARKKAPPSTTPDPDSEQRIPEPDEPPPAEPPADTSDTEQEEG